MVDRARERVVCILRESPGVLPLGLVFIVFLIWAAKDGGFDPLHWLPGALFLLAMLAVYGVTAPGRFAADRSIFVALAALGGFTVWNYASIAWADVRADAWSGANLTLVYAVVFALAVLRPWKAGPAAALIGLLSAGTAAVGLVAFLSATTDVDPLSSFISGRLAVPINYSNANCALFLSALLPALFLSSRRDCHPLIRALMLATAGVLAELALMTQSRASLFVVPVVIAVYLAYVPGRLRTLISLVPLILAVAVSAGRLLAVFDAVVSGQEVRASLVEARSAILWSAAALAVAGGIIGLVDRAVTFPRAITRVASVTAVLVLVTAFVAGGTALGARYGNPADRADEWWAEFASGKYVHESKTPHLISGLGSGRYDIWRVALDAFVDHPIVGIGANQFGVDYARERRRLDDPLYPHSIELRTLSQTGIIGTLLLLTALGSAAYAAIRARYRGAAFSRGLSGAALMAFVYWLAHGSVDWFWEMPALGAPAFALLGIAARLGEPLPGPTAAAVPAGRRSPLWSLVVVLVGAAAAVSLLAPWLSAREMDAAVKGWRADVGASYELLDRARMLNPLSAQPDVLTAVIAAQVGDVGRQRTALLRATRRNPSDWYPLLELGALEARAGNRVEALAWLRLAKALSPLEPILDVVLDGARRGEPVSQAEIDRMLVERAELLVGAGQS